MKNFLTKPRYSLLGMVVVIVCFLVLISFLILKIIPYERKLELVFQSPLPGTAIAQLSDKALKTEAIYQKPYDFGINFFTTKIPVWEKLFADIKGKELDYLEIGVFEGRSLIWMLENVLTDPNSTATGVDIFYGDYEDRFRANLKLSGFSNKVTVIKDYSQIAMRTMPFDSFDIVNIDGSHTKNDVLEDCVLAWRLVRPGGLLLLDDYRYAKKIGKDRLEFCKNAIDAFALCFDEHFEVVHNGHQLILRRIK